MNNFVTDENYANTNIFDRVWICSLFKVNPLTFYTPDSRSMFSFLSVTIYQKDQLSEARFNSKIKLIVLRNRDHFGRAVLLSIIVYLA